MEERYTQQDTEPRKSIEGSLTEIAGFCDSNPRDITSLRGLSTATQGVRQAIRDVAQLLGNDQGKRSRETVFTINLPKTDTTEGEVIFGVPEPTRKVIIIDSDDSVEITLAVEGEAILTGKERGSEKVDIPQVQVVFPTGRFLLPSDMYDVSRTPPFFAKRRDQAGLEEVYRPGKQPDNAITQQEYAAALYEVTGALLQARTVYSQ